MERVGLGGVQSEILEDKRHGVVVQLYKTNVKITFPKKKKKKLQDLSVQQDQDDIVSEISPQPEVKTMLKEQPMPEDNIMKASTEKSQAPPVKRKYIKKTSFGIQVDKLASFKPEDILAAVQQQNQAFFYNTNNQDNHLFGFCNPMTIQPIPESFSMVSIIGSATHSSYMGASSGQMFIASNMLIQMEQLKSDVIIQQ